MPTEILLLESMLPALEAKLDAAYTVHRIAGIPDVPAFAAAHPAIRAVVTGGGSGIRNTVVDALPNLEIVVINGVGTDAVDLAYAEQKRIRVTNTPDVLTDDVADLAIALMLAAARQLVAGDRYVRSGAWARREPVPLAQKVSGKRLGILGLGRIGRAIARRAEGFGMEIAYTNRNAIPGSPYRFVPAVLDLATWSDILIVAASGGAGSRNAIGRPVMDALGAQGILVNIARGTVVDEPALVAALTERTLGGAGLDVFADEPNVPPELLALDHLVLQPHRASATVETRHAMGQLVLDNLAAHLAGQPLLTPVV